MNKDYLSELAYNFCSQVADDNDLEFVINEMNSWLLDRRTQQVDIYTTQMDWLCDKYNIKIVDKADIKDAIERVEILQADEVTDATQRYNELEHLKIYLYQKYIDNSIGGNE